MMLARTMVMLLTMLAMSFTCVAQEQPESGYFQHSYSVADHIHVLRQGPGLHVRAAGNVTVVEQANGLVLIDAGSTPGAGRRVVAMVRAISPKPVKAIIITHWHGDHHFGLSEVLSAWPSAEVIATESTAKNMNHRGLPATPDAKYDAGQIANFEAERAGLLKENLSPKLSADERNKNAEGAREETLYEEDFKGISIRYATVTFTDRLSLLDDEVPIEVMFLGRANTDGDAVVWMPKQRVVAAGDIVVSPIPFGDGSYPLEWVKVLERLRAMDFSVLVPGHGMPQTDKKYLDLLISGMGDINAQMADFVAKGLTMDEAMAKLNLASQQPEFVTDPWLQDFFDGYWKPVATCSYRQTKGSPAVQGKGCHS